MSSTMFDTNTSLHDLQDRLREEIRLARRRTFVINILAIAASACAVALYWHLY